MPETDKELLARYNFVKSEYEKASRLAHRAKCGGTRDRKMRWAGCLNFTLIQIESEIEERGL